MIKISLSILVILFVICVYLNPSIESHRKAVAEKLNKAISTADSSDFDWASNAKQASTIIGKGVFEKSIKIENYLYYSLTRMDIGKNRKVVGIGFLNYVYIYDEIFPTIVAYNKRIVGKPIRVSYFEVAENDFPMELDWYDAKDACLKLGDGWRLPNYYEVMMISKNKDNIDELKLQGFKEGRYWGTSDINASFIWTKESDPPYEPTYNLDEKLLYNVRAIRSINH